METGKRYVAINGQYEEWNALYLDWIDINILVVKLYCNCARCYHRENWVKGSQDPSVLFLTNSCKPATKFQNFKI